VGAVADDSSVGRDSWAIRNLRARDLLACPRTPQRKAALSLASISLGLLTRSARANGRGRDHKRRPIKYLTTKDLEAAGVGLPRSPNSRMISRTRSAQSARNDRKPRCRYKTGTADPPASAPNSSVIPQKKEAFALPGAGILVHLPGRSSWSICARRPGPVPLQSGTAGRFVSRVGN
jgi:hypothetical protein